MRKKRVVFVIAAMGILGSIRCPEAGAAMLTINEKIFRISISAPM